MSSELATYIYRIRDAGGWREVQHAEVPGLAPATEVWVFSPQPGCAVVWMAEAAILGPAGRRSGSSPPRTRRAAEEAGKPVRWYRRS